MKRDNVSFISFDVDYLGGSYSNKDKVEYHCIRECEGCHPEKGRPFSHILPEKEIEKNTEAMISLFSSFFIKKAYMCQCHASILDYVKKGDTVYNIDAHHDMYSYPNRKKDIDCGNWANWLLDHGTEVINCKPSELKKNLVKANKDIHLFISTSPNYASPDTDGHLMRILYSIPCKIEVDLLK
jgi:hypothetical protein